MEKDFIDISCQNKLGLEYYRYQWASIVPKNVSIENGKSFQDENGEHLSVVMFGFDGISRSNFIRQLPKSKTFMDKLGFITMEKHTKIADNTFPNWMGILLGEHTYDYEFPATVDNREHIDYDNWTNLLWRRFSRNGYATLLSEDEPKIATFNYNKRMNGFISRPPTDHYIRPWYLALDEHYLRSRSSKFCYDNFPIHKLQFQYSKSFLQGYKGKRKFLWQWLTEVSHDYLNTVGVVDEDFVKFLTEIQPNFNNSIVIVFSDHGNRYDSIRETVIGRLESRLPFLSIKMPEWFSKKYPKMEENLKANSKILTSHFDLHAMLVQILQGNFSSPPPKLSRGISLLSSIPSNQTCFSAEIPSQFCPCFKEYEIPLSNDTTFADLILQKIHNYFAEKNVLDKCAKMELDSIKSISLSLPPSKLSLDELQPSFKGDLYHYRIQFQVKPPSNAILEGIVVKNKFSGEIKVLNDIERNNRKKMVWPQTIFIGGPTACGKSTISQLLANRLNGEYELADGDHYHSKTSIEKMANGIPLTDEDREGWLRHLSEMALDGKKRIIACSSLKRKYRNLLASNSLSVVFFMLILSEEELMKRVEKRKDHFAKANLIPSQLAALELPGNDEPNAIVIDGNETPENVVNKIVEKLNLMN
uniref:gluconokinase n=1 Tax=Panagrolaimus davidi TaxID=227884 RepID=A0A914QWU0_9BILA